MRNELATYIVIALVIASIITSVLLLTTEKKSQSVGRLRVYTDKDTGCQYVKAFGVGGSLVQRLDANGIHMCGGINEK